MGNLRGWRVPGVEKTWLGSMRLSLPPRKKRRNSDRTKSKKAPAIVLTKTVTGTVTELHGILRTSQNFEDYKKFPHPIVCVLISGDKFRNHFIHVVSLCLYSSQSHRQGSCIVGVPSVNLWPWRFTNNSLGLPHAHSLSVCLHLWVCVVCIWFLLYLSVYLCCARCVFCVLLYIHNHCFLSSFQVFFKSNRNLCHSVSFCTQNLAHMPILLFLLHFHLCNSCVCVCQLVYALSPSSIFIHIYRHIYMYTCCDYSVMTPYNLYAPIVIRLCVPAPRGFASCWHTCDSMFKGLYFNIHLCLCLLWIHTYHLHIKNVQFCVHLPLPFLRSSTMSLSVSIPST